MNYNLMNYKIKRLIVMSAGIFFFTGLFLNISVTLEDPFHFTSNTVLAQSTDLSSSSGCQPEAQTAGTFLILPGMLHANLNVNAAQNTYLTLTNHGLTGLFLRVEEMRPFSPIWTTHVWPTQSQQNTYSIFGHEPIYWSWVVSSTADYANVHIRANWQTSCN